MSGYPHNQPGYGYGGPPPPAQPYATAPPPSYGQATPYGYGQPPTAQPYGVPSAPPYGGPDTKPYKENKPSYGGGDLYYGGGPPSYGGSDMKPHKENKPSYGVGSPSYGGGDLSYGDGAPSYGCPDTKPHKENKPSYGGGVPSYGGAPPYGGGQGYSPAGYGAASQFASLVSSTFLPGTDPNVVACFQMADQDGSGLIDDKELQRALSSYNQSFSLRTVHLLMYLFTNSSSRKIGPKEFTSLFYSLQSWREIFERFDRDRSGKIDVSELREALFSLGFSVSPALLDLLVCKFDKTGGKMKAIEYDNFIECCLTVKGLTEKFKEKDKAYTGSATFTYEDFMLTVLPFLIA